jgi:uncharacterized protein (TIRG00374 family)
MKFNWKIIAGIAISVVFVFFAVSNVDYSQMAEVFARASYIWTIPMIISVILTMWIRALRWQKLMLPIKKLSIKTLYSSVMIGFMANNLLPARIGEVVRAVSLSKKHQISRASVFATVVAERAFDSLGLLVVFLITLIFVDYPERLRQAGLLILILSIAALVFLFLLRTKTDLAVRLICRPISMLSKVFSARVESLLRKFSVGLTILTDPRLIITVMLYSILLWFFSGISGYLIFAAFGLYPKIWAAFIILFVTALAVSLPSSPGYIGTYHGACIIAFNLINSLGMFNHEVSKSVALSYSILLWSCQFFPVTIIGLYYLKKEHFRLKDIEKAEF